MVLASSRKLIVGAGIFGVTAALELRRRGHAVRLIDPGPLPHPDASSTDISKLIRMDYGSDDFYMTMMEAAFPGWDTWNARWERPLYHEVGDLVMSRTPLQPGSFELESWQRLIDRGHRVERISPAGLRARFPAWAAEHYRDGYLNPRAGWAESGQVVATLLAEAAGAGVEVQVGARLVEVTEGGAVTDDGAVHAADQVIVAAGAWTPTLLPELGDLLWAVGQPVLHFRVPPESLAKFQPPHFPAWAADVGSTGWYGFPARGDGTLKLANHGPGRRVRPGDPREVAPHWEKRFRAFFADTFPALVDAELIGTRLCLYCDSWDGDFWIDRHPDRPGLVVATGGSGHAFKFAPLLGMIIADVAEGKPNPYAHRFAWRARGDLRTEDARYDGG